jgi:SAM-dependent methyltransferase
MMRRTLRRIYSIINPVLPSSLKPVAESARDSLERREARRRHAEEKRRFHDHIRRVLGTFAEDVDPGPPWTRELILQTAAADQSSVEELMDPDRFYASGYSMMRRYLEALEPYGFNLRTVRAAYEIGCGSARLIRQLRVVPGIRLVGSDLGESSTEWCRENVPGVEFYRNDLEPPLDFAEDDAFDLVIASSVFTHIPLEGQAAWIDEIHRILHPGGFFACTVLGRTHRELMFDDDARRRFDNDKHLTMTADDERASLSTQVIGSYDVFQTHDEVLRCFGRRFEVLDYLPGHQDLLILRKPPDPGWNGNEYRAIPGGIDVDAGTRWR